MREMNLSDSLALARLAEYLLLFGRFDTEDLLWFTDTFNFKELGDEGSVLNSILKSCTRQVKLERLSMFQFLRFVYVCHAEAFPRLMEEMLRKAFLKILEFNPDTMEHGTKEELDLAKNTFARHLEVLGYEMILNLDGRSFDLIRIHVVEREAGEDRRAERNQLMSLLDARFKDEYTAMKGAYERYMEGGTDASRQAIDSCRNAFENLFKKITGKRDWRKGLNEVTKSKTLADLIDSVYQFLSGYGIHSSKVREKEDAFLAIRLTEDTMIRVFQETGMW